MADSNKFKNRMEKMQDKLKALVDKHAQLRLELGNLEIGISRANETKPFILNKIKEVETQYEQLKAQIDKANASVGAEPPIPEVGLTEDTKREMAEALKGQSNEATDAPAQPASETPAT